MLTASRMFCREASYCEKAGQGQQITTLAFLHTNLLQTPRLPADGQPHGTDACIGQATWRGSALLCRKCKKGALIISVIQTSLEVWDGFLLVHFSFFADHATQQPQDPLSTGT
jgi:hypothetical protein